jgi:dTDP-4-dehydrorhamnose reductase
MRILITGAQGQVGRSLIQALSHHTVSAFSKSELDITNSEQVSAALEKADPHIVINTAAYNAVDEAETRPVVAYEVNENGPLTLAILTAHNEIPLLHFSTDYVFDGKSNDPYMEDAKPNPQSVYGKSKLAGELAVQKNNPDHYIVRTAWVYHEVGKNFPNTILSLADKPEVRVVNDQIGCPTYAPHLAEAVVKLIERGPVSGIYHLAGSGKASWYDVARELYRRMEIKTPVVPVSTKEFPRPAKRPAHAVLASTKLLDISLPPWEQGLDEFVKQTKNKQKGKP